MFSKKSTGRSSTKCCRVNRSSAPGTPGFMRTRYPSAPLVPYFAHPAASCFIATSRFVSLVQLADADTDRSSGKGALNASCSSSDGAFGGLGHDDVAGGILELGRGRSCSSALTTSFGSTRRSPSSRPPNTSTRALPTERSFLSHAMCVCLRSRYQRTYSTSHPSLLQPEPCKKRQAF